MKILGQITVFSTVTVAFAAIALFPISAMADADHITPQERSMDECLDMSKAMMMADPGCKRVIAEMKVSDDDLTKMRACRRMGETAMAQSANCSSMKKRDLEAH